MSARRCFICGADDWKAAALRTCGHCGVRVRGANYDAHACAQARDALLRPGPCVLTPDLPFAADAFTWRIAASRSALAFWPIDEADATALAFPHSPRLARGYLRPRAPAPPRVTLAMILRADRLDTCLDLWRQWRTSFAGAVFVVDAPAGEGPHGDGVRIVQRPLEGNFGAQRNAAQALAQTPWVLQLDDDEEPSDALLGSLDALSAYSEAQNVVSVGFPRRNLVDGAWSDLWPDIQYRLNHRSVRFGGRVHERPITGGWRRTTIALDGVIDHHLERSRVVERSVRYEAMGAGGGRPGDEAALLRPYRA